MDKIYQIYDKAYKQLFSNHEIFRELLETFVKLDWVKKIDFSKLEKIDKTFISEKYLKTESDIIYKLKLIDDTEIYIYVLLEFQSSLDKFMPIRCLNYITNLYLEMIKEKGTNIELPAIFPLVLYNGDDKWSYSNKVSDFINNNNILGNYGISFDIFLIKENTYTLTELLEIKNLVSTLFITEVYYDSELIFQEVQKILDKYGITIPVKLFLNYFKNMSLNEKIDIIDNNELEKMYQTKEEVNSMLLTAIRKEKEALRQEGEIIGIQKGEVIGIQKGIQKTAKNLLKMGLTLEQISQATNLSIEELKLLQNSLLN